MKKCNQDIFRGLDVVLVVGVVYVVFVFGSSKSLKENRIN